MKNCRLLILSIMSVLLPLFLSAATNPCWSVEISSSPSPAFPGDTVTFRATLQIKFEPVANLRVIGVVDGITLYDNTFASLGAGVTREISFTWTATLGDHRAFLQIDPEDTIEEVGRDNLTELSFTTSARPPLTPLNILFDHNSVAPDREISGEESFINYRIYIDSPLEAPLDVPVAFMVNGRQISTQRERFDISGIPTAKYGRFVWRTECGANIEVLIDPMNLIPETDETDNSWTHSVVCSESPKPNLIISRPSWSPYHFHAGDLVTINYTVNNIGENECGAYQVGLKAGDRIVARNGHAAHHSGVTQTGTITWTAECSGPLSLVADCDSEITESNESDNSYQNPDLACAVPNLTAVRIECEYSSPVIPAGIEYEYRFVFRLSGADELTNVSARVGIIGGDILAEKTWPSLEGHRYLAFNKELPAGIYTLYAIIDPENTIAESDETDNRIEKRIRIGLEENEDSALPGRKEKGNNYKITIDNKKSLLKSPIAPSDDVWILGELSNTGNKSLVPENVRVRLVEENHYDRTTRTVTEETISLAPNGKHKIKWRWNPAAAYNYKLILRIVAPATDAVPNDNKDEIIIKVK